MATQKTNTDNRYYNKLININQKSFIPIFTDNRLIISQNYNNGSWVILSEQGNHYNTYKYQDTTGKVIYGTYEKDGAKFYKGTSSIKNYIHDIYLAGEHIAGGFGVASAELRDNLTYVGNTYNAVFTYIVDGRTKLALYDKAEDERGNAYLSSVNVIDNVQQTNNYITANNTAVTLSLDYNSETNSYGLLLDSFNYNHGLIWDNKETDIKKRPNDVGPLEVQDYIQGMLYEHDVLWDDESSLLDETIICTAIIHYGEHKINSNAVSVSGPLRRQYRYNESSPYSFRYYYNMSDLYKFAFADDINKYGQIQEGEDNIIDSMITLFNYRGFGNDYAKFNKSQSNENLLYFTRKYSGNAEIKIAIDLLNCCIDIDLHNFIKEYKEDIAKNRGINIDIFFLPYNKLSEVKDYNSKYENAIIFFYRYVNNDVTSSYEQLLGKVDNVEKKITVIEEYENIINNQNKRIEDLETKLEQFINNYK